MTCLELDACFVYCFFLFEGFNLFSDPLEINLFYDYQCAGTVTDLKYYTNLHPYLFSFLDPRFYMSGSKKSHELPSHLFSLFWTPTSSYHMWHGSGLFWVLVFLFILALDYVVWVHLRLKLFVLCHVFVPVFYSSIWCFCSGHELGDIC